MQYFKQFLAFVFSRQMLALVAMLALALLVWFAGPLVAVAGLHPLASVGMRITVIVLMLVLAILWLVSGPFSLVGIAALCLLVWHAGPLLALGSAQPFAPVWVRVLVIGIILLVYALYWLYRLWQALRNNDDLLAKFLNFGKDATQDEAAKEELKTVAASVSRAIAQLKTLRARGGALRRLLEGKRYLYELPWYMIIGSPGAGKTTAVLNSGLQFPLARQMGNAPKSMVLQSAGGTLHCDWWFTNEAVLIDTAGRYTTHDSDPTKDTAEWTGFLGLLRKHRARAPINGAIVALNAAQLLTLSAAERAQHASQLRERLAELRQELGIRFPVYVIVTKMDLLRGFGEYFQSLTSEGRTQTWGFTLPYQGAKGAPAATAVTSRDSLRQQLSQELVLLKERLAAGLRSRLNEEFDVERRRRLFALPQELAGLSVPLVEVLEEVFLDSRFDDTQWQNALRGVYFTSGAQAEVDLPADPSTLLQRLWRSLGRSPAQWAQRSRGTDAAARGLTALNEEGSSDAGIDARDETTWPGRSGQVNTMPTRSQQGFFLQHLFGKVIIPEAHLVRPNLRWEFRFRLLRLTGHALAILLFMWLAGALALSFNNNRQYLETVDARARLLAQQVKSVLIDFKPESVPTVLSGGRELPGYAGLDVEDPPAGFLYGLYAVPPVLHESGQTYAQLQDHLLLPLIVRRMETVLAQSVKDRDANTAYETLRSYKILHDRQRYMQDGGARDVGHWVLNDWEMNDSAALFGGRASMIAHAESLFSGERLVQAASLPNMALIREAQNFLNGNTSTQRVYERAKAAMLPEAPQEFTLVRAVGPQAGTVFSRTDGQPLERGVPGLFTYEGYHDLFNKRLPEFVDRALEDDAWVMGRSVQGTTDGRSEMLDTASRRLRQDPLLEDIRRQYLSEYVQRWDDFLGSVRTVNDGGVADSNLGFDLSVLRQFAAPDSPLARLARAAARETTLSRPLLNRPQEDRSLLEKASDELAKQRSELNKNLGIRREERLERQIVDNHFAALREVVTGQADTGATAAAQSGNARPGLETISGLVNEFYTLLVVADTALNAGSLPPGGTDVGARLRLEASKLPAPIRAVLTGLADSGSEKVARGATDIVRKQAQLQLDRIMGLMAMQVSEPCQRGVAGRYPFVPVAQDASIEDFTQVFAVGGAADDFFTKYLSPFVDTSQRPWRYKSPATANAMVGAENIGAGVAPAAATSGVTVLGELLKLLPRSGPDLEVFYRAQQIRDLFFRDAGGKKMSWKMDVKVLELEPTITDLIIDIDGQGQRYVHGPVQAFNVSWPGPRGGAMAELTANPRISGPTSTLLTNGPWALFRLLDKGQIVGTATPGRVSVEFKFDGRKAILDISSSSQANPLNSDLFRGFHCPGRSM